MREKGLSVSPNKQPAQPCAKGKLVLKSCKELFIESCHCGKEGGVVEKDIFLVFCQKYVLVKTILVLVFNP